MTYRQVPLERYVAILQTAVDGRGRRDSAVMRASVDLLLTKNAEARDLERLELEDHD